MKGRILLLAALFGFSLGEAIAAPNTGHKPTHLTINPLPSNPNPCPQSAGTLNLTGVSPRVSGVSPLLVFFDDTATSDSSLAANLTAFEGVTYTWDFGDTGASGTGSWPNGAAVSYYNNKNRATGGAVAHLYQTSGTNQTYIAQVTASDGTNVITCSITVSVTDPSQAGGFPGAATTCVAANSTPAAGVAGCPAGAAVLQQSSFVTALNSAFGSAKRVLFNCGDTFTGNTVTLTGTKWSIGAYGGCENTQVSLPVISSTANSQGAFIIALTSGDGRIADLDFEGGGSGHQAINTPGSNTRIPYQITLYNLNSSGNASSFAFSQCAQCAMVQLFAQNARAGGISLYFNYNQNNPNTWAGNLFNNLDYAATIGVYCVGPGAGGGAGVECERIGAGRKVYVANSSYSNSNTAGALLKVHNGNTNNTLTAWTGVYTEYVNLTDNDIGCATSGFCLETSPQNPVTDERVRIVVVERNLIHGPTAANGGQIFFISGQNITARNNVLYGTGNGSTYPIYAVTICQRGNFAFPTQFVSAYNNTGYLTANQAGQAMFNLGTTNSACFATSTQGIIRNNLFYMTQAGHPVVSSVGSNTASNNSPTVTANPGFVNGAAFSLISDFQPTANYAGGTTVPVLFDALGTTWAPTWNLGAVHH